MLEELYRRLMEKRRREQTTARPQSAASSKRGASVDSDEPYMSDGVVDYGYDAHVAVIVVRKLSHCLLLAYCRENRFGRMNSGC